MCLSSVHCLAKTALRSFARGESGTITTDYIILTGAIMGAALGGVTSVRMGVADLAFGVETSLTGAEVAIPFDTGPQPVGWVETMTMATAGTRCAPAPEICNFTPPTRWEYAYLEMDDGTRLERVTTTEYPDTKSATSTVIWRDKDGNEVDAPANAPELDYKSMTCDKWGNCTL